MILNSLEIIPAKTNNVLYMPTINWYKGVTLPENNKEGVVVDNTYYTASIKNNKFSIKNLKLKTAVETNRNNDKLFYNNIELKTITFNKNVNILLENIKLVTEIDYDNDQQVFEFVNYNQELFEIIDTTKNQSFYVIFQFIADNIYTKQIFVRFEYKPSNNLGDVNGDGVIDLRDLVALSDHVVQGKEINKPEYADINKTDEITKHDVIELSRRILHG